MDWKILFHNGLTGMVKASFIVIFFLPLTLYGQYSTKYLVPQDMKFSSIGLHVGFYQPSMYSYDELYFADFTEGKFQGNAIYGGTLSFRLRNDWYLRGGLDYWTESVATETIVISDHTVSEKLRLNLLMAQLMLVYELPLTRHFYLQAGAGGVLGRLYSDHQRLISTTAQSFTAASYPIMITGYGSINYTFDGYVDLGLELRAIYGRSNHFIADFRELAMSTAGPAAVVRVAYNFQNRWFRRKSHGAFRNHDSRSL